MLFSHLPLDCKRRIAFLALAVDTAYADACAQIVYNLVHDIRLAWLTMGSLDRINAWAHFYGERCCREHADLDKNRFDFEGRMVLSDFLGDRNELYLQYGYEVVVLDGEQDGLSLRNPIDLTMDERSAGSASSPEDDEVVAALESMRTD